MRTGRLQCSMKRPARGLPQRGCTGTGPLEKPADRQHSPCPVLFRLEAAMPRMTLPQRTESIRPQVLSVYRVVIALLFVTHGARTLFGVLGPGRTAGFLEWPSWWAAAIQLVAGSLVLVGLFTRPAALLCSGSMAYAYFTVHVERALWPLQNGGEGAALFCWGFFLIAVFGAGVWSLDHALAARRHSSDDAPPPPTDRVVGPDSYLARR
jgi:putative oxidoreductase